MRQEIFYLAYHLHWSWSDILSMNIGERKNYVHMLSERIEAENQAFENLSKRMMRGVA